MQHYTVTSIAPSEALSLWVYGYRIIESRVEWNPTAAPVERVLPDATSELAVQCASVFAVDTPRGYEPLPRSFLTGYHTSYRKIRLTGNVRLLSAQLRPGVVFRLLGQSLKGTTNGVFDFPSVFGRLGAVLEERVCLAPSWHARIRILERFLRRQLATTERDADLARASMLIHQSGGSIRLTALAKQLGASPRTVERRFLTQLGLTPKQLSRVVRFSKVVDAIRQRRHPTLTELAHEAGFFDQSHFNRDFRTISGLNPGALLQELHAPSYIQLGLGEPEARFGKPVGFLQSTAGRLP